MPRTSFTPRQHGFHFDNDFVNRTATLPGFGEIETRGRCGGMAYAALDFHHRLRRSRGPRAQGQGQREAGARR